MNRKKLKEELKKIEIEMMKAQTSLGMAKVGKEKKRERGTSGSDILKRLRKEKARILTVLNENKSYSPQGESGR